MIFSKLTRTFAWMLLAFAGIAFAGLAQAAAVLSEVKGDVRTAPPGRGAAPAAQNEQLGPGTAVLTGEASQAVIRFDDGQVVALGQNTSFKIVDFAYNSSQPSEGRVVMDLLKGALRSITGLIARANHQAFALRVPQATIGIRGTDFLVDVEPNPGAFVSVNNGIIAVTNDAGTTLFGPGQAGAVASATSLPTGVAASQLPAGVASEFSGLNGLGGLGGLSGGAGAGGAAAGLTAGDAALIGAGIVAAGAIGAASGGSSTTTHH